MRTTGTELLACLVATACALGAAEPPSADWPMLSGPNGDWNAARFGHTLVEDLSLVRTAWVSEPLLGHARIGRTSKDQAKEGGKVFPQPGGCGSPIIAGGRVFVSTYKPTGTAVPADLKDAPPEAGAPFAYEAEDQVVAFDQATGKHLWTASEPGGVNRYGGKRTSYGPTPAAGDGLVFSLGTMGDLRAYDAISGQRRWEAELPGTKSWKAKRADFVAGKDVAGPLMLTGVTVVPGRVIVPDLAQGLVGFDTATGKQLWHLPQTCADHTTPTLVSVAGQTLLVTIGGGNWRNSGGGDWTCTAIDPADGRIAWTVKDLGPMTTPVPAGDGIILLNVRKLGPGKEGNRMGRWGAFRVSAGAATPIWSLPDQPAYDWGWGLDRGPHRKAAIRDGLVHLNSLEREQRWACVAVADGRIVAESQKPEGKRTRELPAMGVPRLFEDRLLCAGDEVHGGTSMQFDWWRVTPRGLEKLYGDWAMPDLQASGYEVPIDRPYVDGRLYTRTDDGRIACYDLRAPASAQRLDLALADGFHGLPGTPLPLRLFLIDGALAPVASAYPPTDAQAGLVYGKDRRFARWERSLTSAPSLSGDRLTATVEVDHGTGTYPVQLTLVRSGEAWTGTWTRNIPGLPTPIERNGTIGGAGPFQDRRYGTPWLKDSPWQIFGPLPAGSVSWHLALSTVFRSRKDPNAGKGMNLFLDHDGNRFTRSLAAAFSMNTAWHELDVSDLRLEGGHLAGRVDLCLNPDRFVGVENQMGSLGASLELDATLAATGITGTWKGRIGVPLTWTGAVTGSSTPCR